MLATLTQVLGIANWSRDDFNNWKRRADFWTDMPPTTPGVAQELSRENALEVAFLAAVAEVGADPYYGTRLEVLRWLREEKSGKLTPAWAANPQAARAKALKGGQPIGQGFRNFAEANVGKLALNLRDEPTQIPRQGKAGHETKPATVLVLIDRAEIVRRIDTLFEKGGSSDGS
jgi:DNA-binding transcriptional ArsR family regulator